MTRVVLDTNVVISALVFEGPAGGAVRSLWKDRQRLTLLVSKALLAEYIRVLHYPKFGLTPDHIKDLIEEDLLPFIAPVRVTRTPRVIRVDPSDNHVLACAVAGKADAMVSGDHHLLKLSSYQGIPVLTLAQFLKPFNLS